MADIEEVARDLTIKTMETRPLAGPEDPVRLGRHVGELYKEILKAVSEGRRTLPPM